MRTITAAFKRASLPRAAKRGGTLPPFLGFLACLTFSVTAAGCSPVTGTVDGAAEDFSLLRRDMQAACEPVTGNLLGNPGFEQPSPGAPDGNGQAVSGGNPPSSIPGGPLGPWDGCCSQPTGGTSWTVRTTMPHCGARAVAVASEKASANVLNQRVDLAAYSGRSVRASAFVFIAQAQSGAALAVDLFDLTASQIIASSPPLDATTADWRYLSVTGTVPTGGAVQIRLRSTGSFSAVVDDAAVVPQ